MTHTVEEIMNREVLSLRSSDDVEEAIGYLLGMGVSGAPVVDREGHPVGIVSFRDLLAPSGGSRVLDRMKSPVVTVGRQATIEAAARLLSERGFHRLIVVDDEGLVVGVVSVLDCMRALCGLLVRHSASFLHYDRATGLAWTDDLVLCRENLELAPSGPGIVVLRVGGMGRHETDVWIEAADDVRARLRDMLFRPQDDRRLYKLLARFGQDLRFRVCAAPDAERRNAALDQLKTARAPWVLVNVPTS